MSVSAPPLGAATFRRGLLLRLRFLQVRLWSELLTTAAVRGLCFGLAVALGGAVALVMQAGVVEREWLAVAAVGGLALGLLWGLIRPPTLARTARTADDRYGLEARLGTAIELLRQGSGRFIDAQLADAAARLQSARGRWPFPPLVAWRESLLAAALGLALVVALQFEGRGEALLVNLPLAPAQPALEAGEREALADPSLPPATAPRGAGQPQGKPSAALRTLDELKRARESGALAPGQAAGMLDQVESELSQQAAAARGQRETLDRLARALSQVSAGDAAAESLQRGDLNQAAQDLQQLGREADQLSPEAKSQLAQALRRAAAESPTNPALAERERRAAEALAGKDYQAAASALNALGEEVARSGSQAAAQSDLSEAFERLQEERSAGAAGASGASAGDERGAPGGAMLSSSEGGQAGGSLAGEGEGSGRGGSGGVANDAPAPGQNGRQAPIDGPAEKAGPSEVGAPAPRLDTVGKQVEVPARPGGGDERGGLTERADGDEEVVNESETSFDSGRPAAPVQAGGQSERIVVPGDQRQVVRDYFAKRGGRGTP